MTKRYKVWAVGSDASRQRTSLLEHDALEREDGAFLLLRTGCGETSPCDVGAFDGSAAEVAQLACERTGYAGTVEVKDFGREKKFGEVDTSDEVWYHGRASSDGATVAQGRRLTDEKAEHAYTPQIGDTVQIMRDETTILARVVSVPSGDNPCWFGLESIEPRAGTFEVKRSEMIVLRRRSPP